MADLRTNLELIKQEKDTKIIPENIKKGVNIFGVEGIIQSGIDTSDATASVENILVDKTAYVNGKKLIGTMPNNGTLNMTPSNIEQQIPAGYTSGGIVATDVNLLPENIKKGINIFGIDGALESGVKQFATIEEMNQSTGNKEGDLAVVYAGGIVNLTAIKEFTKAFLPSKVILPQAITESIFFNFEAVDSSKYYISTWGMLDSSSLDCTFSLDDSTPEPIYAIHYVSDDGITYTRDNKTPAEITFNFPIKASSGWNDTVGYFFQVVDANFNGIFEYKNNIWKNAPTQLNAKSKDVYKAIFYGENGLENGTLADTVSDTFADTAAELYSTVQQKYENMSPKILTDDNKTLDKQIYTIPIKIDGTPLLDTSAITDMFSMFDGCRNLVSIPLLNTSKVTTMEQFATYCISLKNIALLNTANVTNMNRMFHTCSNLNSVPRLDTSNVITMESMFYNCKNLTTIPQLSTAKASNMRDTFVYCPNLSDGSLDNILQMCINSKETNKTLEHVGLSQEQATKCATLPSWQMFLNTGWTSGY